MSSLSSLQGAPIPLRRSADPFGSEAKGDELSSLSNAPPLGVRGDSGLGGGLGRDAASRRSTPITVGSRADDEDELFPKARGLVRKEARKPGPTAGRRAAGTGADSDSSDNEGAIFPSAGRRAVGAGAKNSPAKLPAATSANPILAMLGDEDDEFLKGLAPPVKPAPASITPASTDTAAGVSRSSSARTPTAGTNTRGAAAVQSVDTLMSFLKDDDDIFSKPLPTMDEKPLDLFGSTPKAAPIPRRGRRAGGISDDPAPSMAEPPQTSARPIEEDSTTGGMDFGRRSASIKREPSVASRQSAGFGLDDNGGDELPGLGLNSAQEPSKGFLDTGPSFAPVGSPLTEPLGRHEAAAPLPQPAPLLVPKPKEHPLDLSDDLPGLGSPVVTPSIGGRSQVPTPASTASATSTRPGLPPKGPSAPGLSKTAAKPAAGDSWELDDGMLPDDSGSAGTFPGKDNGAPAATPLSPAPAPAVGAASRQPSRLQQSSSARPMTAPAPAHSSDSGDDEDEPTGYMPSFSSNTRRSAPTPGGMGLGGRMLGGTEAGQPRQRRNLNPDVASSQPNLTLGRARTPPKLRDEDVSKSFSQPAAAAKPLSAAPFRLPSETRPADALSVSISSPASATPKPSAFNATTPTSGPLAGRRAGLPTSRNIPDPSFLDSSTDDELFPAPQRGASPAPGVKGNADKPGGLPGHGRPGKFVTSSAPDALHMHGQQPAPQAQMQQQMQPQIQQQMQPQMQPQMQQQMQPQIQQQMQPQMQQQMQPQMQAATTLPPGVQLGTARSHVASPATSPTATTRVAAPTGTAAALEHGAHMPAAAASPVPAPAIAPSPMPVAGLPPGVTPLGPNAVHAHFSPLPVGGLPPGITPVASAPVPGVVHYAQPAPAQMPQPAPIPMPDLDDVKQLLERVVALQGEQEKGSVEAKKAHEEKERLKKQNQEETEQIKKQAQEDTERLRKQGIEEADRLRKEVQRLEKELRDKDTKLREAEEALSNLESNSKISLANTQALALEEASVLRADLEQRKHEVERLTLELQQQRVRSATELKEARDDAAQQVAAAMELARHEGKLAKEGALAMLKEQREALAKEKEIIESQTISAKQLAELSRQIHEAALTTKERDERTAHLLERGLDSREARVKQREDGLREREDKVSKRELELDALHMDLRSLKHDLESVAIHGKEDLRKEHARLARESVRMDALQGSLLDEREDLRVQIQIERRLLEEARDARRKERDVFMKEAASERSQIATEYATVQRQLDAARAELLALKTRVIDYEARAATALKQAITEEERVAKAKHAADSEEAAIAAAYAHIEEKRAELDSEAAALVEYAARLQAQSSELAASNTELDDLKVELVRQRQEVAMELAQARNLAAEVDKQRHAAEQARMAAERERLSMAAERRDLSEERVAASRAADAARDAQLKLAEAVRQWVAQGVPIPFAVQSLPGSGLAVSSKPAGADGMSALGAPMISASPDKRGLGVANSKRERAVSAAVPARRSKNTLKHMLDKLGLDLGELGGNAPKPSSGADGGGAYNSSSYVRQQKEFLTSLRMSAPDAHAPAGVVGAGMDAGYGTYSASRGSPLKHTAGFDFSQLGTATPTMAGFAGMVGGTPGAYGLSGHTAGGGMSFRPQGAGLHAAAPVTMRHGHMSDHDMLMSDLMDKGTLVSSEFTSMAPMSATTSEHDVGSTQGASGGNFSLAGTQAGSGGAGGDAGSLGKTGSQSQGAGSTSSQGSRTPARSNMAQRGNGMRTQLTSDLSDTALSPLALQSSPSTSASNNTSHSSRRS